MKLDVETAKGKIKYGYRKTKDWVSDRVYDVKKFCQLHPQEAIEIATIAVGGAVKIGKSLASSHNIAEEERIKEEYWYDRSLGHYWALKRRPTKKECLEIDRRKQNGERLGDIFESMNLLR